MQLVVQVSAQVKEGATAPAQYGCAHSIHRLQTLQVSRKLSTKQINTSVTGETDVGDTYILSHSKQETEMTDHTIWEIYRIYDQTDQLYQFP